MISAEDWICLRFLPLPSDTLNVLCTYCLQVSGGEEGCSLLASKNEKGQDGALRGWAWVSGAQEGCGQGSVPPGPRAGWQRPGPQPKGRRATAEQNQGKGMVLQKEGRSVRSPCFLIPEAPWRGRSEENLDLLPVRLVLGGGRVLLLLAGHGETQQRLSPRRGAGQARRAPN